MKGVRKIHNNHHVVLVGCQKCSPLTFFQRLKQLQTKWNKTTDTIVWLFSSPTSGQGIF